MRRAAFRGLLERFDGAQDGVPELVPRGGIFLEKLLQLLFPRVGSPPGHGLGHTAPVGGRADLPEPSEDVRFEGGEELARYLLRCGS